MACVVTCILLHEWAHWFFSNHGHQSSAEDGLEVLVVMNKMGLISLVNLLASFLHILGQSRGSTAEHTKFTHLHQIIHI